MEIFKKQVNRRLLFHCIFWCVMLLLTFSSESWQYEKNIKWSVFPQFVFAFLVFISVSYFNIYYLIPRYFKAKKYWQYAAILAFALFVGGATAYIFKELYLHLGIANADFDKGHKEEGFEYIFHILFGEIAFVLFTSFFSIIEEWINFQNVTIQMKEIESKKVQAELEALKAQVNPHFLFNTLNNIYSYSLDSSPKTPGMILKLSELMSYILYDCQEEKVPIENELSFIKSYIELESLRYEDKLEVEITIPEIHSGTRISPLLLIPFVENAFKHAGSCGQRKFVHVMMNVSQESIVFAVKNSVDSDENIPKRSIKESGIGIENVKRRLELLYPGLYTLQIIKDENTFSVELRISQNGNPVHNS